MYVVEAQNQEAEEAIGAALSLLDSHEEGRSHVVPYYVQAQIRMLHRDNASAIEWGRRAIRLAEQFGDAPTLINATNAVGCARIFSGDEEGGRADLERSRQMALDAGLELLVSNAYTNLGSCFGEMFRFELAENYLIEGIAYASARDLDHLSGYMQSWLALTRMYQGRWDEASVEVNAVMRLVSASIVSRIMSLVALGRLRARRGDPEVFAVLDEALALAEPTGTLQRIAPVRAARAEAAWMAGDRKRTVTEASAAYDMALKHGHPWFVGELGYWLWKGGALHEPDPIAAAPWAMQMRGDLAGAAEKWLARGCQFEAARALVDAEDEGHLRQALAIFERLRSVWGVTTATRRLRELGFGRIPRGPRSSTRAHPAGLTRREQEILQLIADGESNGEIAGRLFVSPKTVEHHVSSILTKLGVSRRSDAVDAERLLIADDKVKGDATQI